MNWVDFWDKEETSRPLSLEGEESRRDARETHKKMGLIGRNVLEAEIERNLVKK